MEDRNPFRSSVNVSERAAALKTFTAQQCRDAIVYTPSLQASTLKALKARLTRLEKAAPGSAGVPPAESVTISDCPCASVPAFTPGPYKILLDGTCSGTWPSIVTEDDPDGDNPVAELRTAYVEKTSVRNTGARVGSYTERPENFEPTDDCEEILATASLFCAAPDMYAALEILAGIIHGDIDTTAEYRQEQASNAKAILAAAREEAR